MVIVVFAHRLIIGYDNMSSTLKSEDFDYLVLRADK